MEKKLIMQMVLINAEKSVRPSDHKVLMKIMVLYLGFYLKLIYDFP